MSTSTNNVSPNEASASGTSMPTVSARSVRRRVRRCLMMSRRWRCWLGWSLVRRLGLADNPAELVGYGPIPPIAAAELAADADWRRLVVDPVDGHLLDYGTSVYRPPQKLANYLIARDRRCRFPGCARQAETCDFDHVIAFGTPGGWRYKLHNNGAITWTSPYEQTFEIDPHGQLE